MVEFALENSFASLPKFTSWVSHPINKKHHITKKISSNYWTWTHKDGIGSQKPSKKLMRLARKNIYHPMQDAKKLQMQDVRPAFEIFMVRRRIYPSIIKKQIVM